jgi:hypothetical protein
MFALLYRDNIAMVAERARDRDVHPSSLPCVPASWKAVPATNVTPHGAEAGSRRGDCASRVAHSECGREHGTASE